MSNKSVKTIIRTCRRQQENARKLGFMEEMNSELRVCIIIDTSKGWFR
jgi:hypothetical protein